MPRRRARRVRNTSRPPRRTPPAMTRRSGRVRPAGCGTTPASPAPARPSVAPIIRPSRARGSRISQTMRDVAPSAVPRKARISSPGPIIVGPSASDIRKAAAVPPPNKTNSLEGAGRAHRNVECGHGVAAPRFRKPGPRPRRKSASRSTASTLDGRPQIHNRSGSVVDGILDRRCRNAGCERYSAARELRGPWPDPRTMTSGGVTTTVSSEILPTRATRVRHG